MTGAEETAQCNGRREIKSNPSMVLLFMYQPWLCFVDTHSGLFKQDIIAICTCT